MSKALNPDFIIPAAEEEMAEEVSLAVPEAVHEAHHPSMLYEKWYNLYISINPAYKVPLISTLRLEIYGEDLGKSISQWQGKLVQLNGVSFEYNSLGIENCTSTTQVFFESNNFNNDLELEIPKFERSVCLTTRGGQLNLYFDEKPYPLECKETIYALRFFEQIIKMEIYRGANSTKQIESLVEYAQDILDNKQKVSEYPYAAVLLAHMWHLSKGNDYKPLCEKIYEMLLMGVANKNDAEASSYALNILVTQLNEAQHCSITLKNWNGLYCRRKDDWRIAKYKIQKAVQKEKLLDLSLTDMEEIQLPDAFEEKSLTALNIGLKVSTTLHQVISELNGLLIKSAKNALYIFICDAKHFIEYFESEASLVGGVKNYFSKLNSFELSNGEQFIDSSATEEVALVGSANDYFSQGEVDAI